MDAKQLSRTELINQWAQIIGIAAAGLWGGYVFIHKEFLQPAAVPVNVSVELSLAPSGATRLASVPGDVIPVAMTMSVRNPSARQVAFLPSVFVVSGDTFAAQRANFDDLVAKTTIDTYQRLFAQRHAALHQRQLIAIGSAFPDDMLKPGETLTRQIVLYVPANTYDVLTARVNIPSARGEHQLSAEWNVVPHTDKLHTGLYQIRDGKRVAVKPDGAGGYDVDEDFDLQLASAETQIVLPRVTEAAPTSPR
jgi:hypothetical protein